MFTFAVPNRLVRRFVQLPLPSGVPVKGVLLLSSLLVLAVTACTPYGRELDFNPPFTPHRFRSFDVEVNWRTERTDSLVRVEGTVTNRRSFYLQYLETTVRLLDDKGRLLGRESFTDFPTYLPPGKTEPFRMEFRLPPGAAPARLGFTYTYWLAEEPPAFRVNGDVPHFGHFESPP